jgi:hypothetical protein
MAGGDLTVYTGGDFLCQAGTFGHGNLRIFSGGDMEGRFLIKDGKAELYSMGNFGMASNGAHYPIETWGADIHVAAQGDLGIGTIINPTLARPYLNEAWDLEYSKTASVSLTSITGNVRFYGDDSFYGQLTGDAQARLSVLPPTLEIAAGKDILLSSDFSLAPSPTGNLSLMAGGNIVGRLSNGAPAHIYMSERDPDQVYGNQPLFDISTLFANSYSSYDQKNVLHAGDNSPAEVLAGGDISNLQFFLPKQAYIYAQGDIRDIYYFGHNISKDDVTTIKADGSILFSPVNYSSSSLTSYKSFSGLKVGGPGVLFVEAGASLDLGNTGGIQSVGNSFNSLLSEKGCTLIVASGYSKDFSDAKADADFFSILREKGIEFSNDIAAGNSLKARQVAADAKANVIAPFFAGAASGSGDINMTTSQISTLAGSDIFIFTNGSLNVGKSTFFADPSQIQSTGIFTAGGGGISIFANKDINVNESRVMTFMGGDITVWSDTGGINAGRGSKTAVNASPPTLKWVNGQQVLQFNPPAVGSGIRAVTYDPDGVDGPLPAPPAGDIYLFAPNGIIDAGEAGIAGKNVFIGATQVLNAGNISFSAGSVGVPSSSTSSGSLGSLSGVGGVNQDMKAQEATATSAASNRVGQNVTDTGEFGAGTLDVKVISYVESDDDPDRDKQSDSN